MQYMLLIYNDPKTWQAMSEAERGKMAQDFMAFTQSIVKSGHFRAGSRLEAATTATTLRDHNGKVVSTDGPFAETKEQLAGYYLVECKNLDEALSLGARIPSVRAGGLIEVRPVAPPPQA